MKKLLIIALAITLILTLAAGCGNNNSDAKDAKENTSAVQVDTSAGDFKALSEAAVLPEDPSLKGIIKDGEAGGMMSKAQTAPVNEDWATATASE